MKRRVLHPKFAGLTCTYALLRVGPTYQCAQTPVKLPVVGAYVYERGHVGQQIRALYRCVQEPAPLECASLSRVTPTTFLSVCLTSIRVDGSSGSPAASRDLGRASSPSLGNHHSSITSLRRYHLSTANPHLRPLPPPCWLREHLRAARCSGLSCVIERP